MSASESTPEAVGLRAEGRVARRQAWSRASRWILLGATLLGLVVLVVLGIDNAITGIPALDWDFLVSYPSRKAELAGIRPGILGLIWVLALTVILAIPLAVGAAIWMEEFAPRNAILTTVRLNIANLAGVPSIIYGILGLAVFVRLMELGPSILAGALTLALMILPMTVITSVEAISQVPPSIREGSLALGATRWQTVWNHVLPGAMPGILTGTILAVARAAGETAALIVIGAAAFIAADPSLSFAGLLDSFTTLPMQVYSWTLQTKPEFRANAAAGIIVLMIAVIGLNALALVVRDRLRRN
ncbi:MAG: phosphate ABC transporter permease PstA [Dehalococcoidia bacterium]|nr:phosphate ABC transporter permease PstA [Dehalococcoidia bacterium]MXY87685.1 phosphate ABC transporter permease PstA [Dehalococcoidia bacterium]MYA53416.1 phosphate ABC transporter permease PstA [Dehalococcoidia bacterium]